MKKKEILKSVMMDTETTFHANGSVTSYPNSWEKSKAPVTLNSKEVVLRGRMAVQADGSTVFTAYRHDTGKRYKVLFRVLNGELKETQENIVVNLCMSKRLSAMRKAEALREQMEQICEHIENEQC